MNPATLKEALDLFDFYLAEISKYKNIQLVVCPPAVYLEELSKQIRNPKSEIRNLSLGAQNMFWEKSDPYAGETSVGMLRDFSVTHVLVGHSDRRYKIGLPSTTLNQSKVVLGETDEVINKKIKAALAANIVPVLLVGERNRGDDRRAVLEQQLAADLVGLTTKQISKILITYEPVWAISTQPNAESDTPESASEALKLISEFLTSTYNLAPSTYFYGGSVNSQNVADFLQHPELSGAIIGGASLRKDEFGEILKITSGLTQ